MQDGQQDRHSHPPNPSAPRRAFSRKAARAKGREGTYQAWLEPLASIKSEPTGTLPPVGFNGRGPERCENDAAGAGRVSTRQGGRVRINHFHHPSRHDEQGVALLLAILVLALLVALILEFDSDARREYREAAAFRDNFKASVLTRAAVQAARAVLQQDHLRDKQTGQMYDATTDLWAFPIQKYAIGDGLMSAQIEDERSKLNLNDLATAIDPNVKKTKVLRFKRLFGLLQINPDLVDAIIDWVDADDIPEAAGAESVYYQALRPSYRAANAPLQTMRELRLIKGMTPEIVDRLLQYVTIYPQEGESRININTADVLVLQSLDPRISQSMAGEVIQSRPFKTVQDLDRVGSFAEIAKELRLLSVYDVKTDIFSANMTLTVNETTKSGIVVLQRDEATGNSAVRYFRFL
jgi:general secretion pathway protein K